MDVVDVITSLGFPAGVAIFALWNSQKNAEYLQGVLQSALKENTEAIQELKILIEKVAERRKEDD